MEMWAGAAAIVTGGASGLGAATARALAARGMRVAVFDLSEAAGRELAGEIGGLFLRVDVSDPASVSAAGRGGRGGASVCRACW